MANEKLNILAVDDEKEFTEMTRQYFELRGHSVEVAGNGLEGLEKFSKGKFDVVLLDLRMPGMSGDVAMKKMLEIDPDVKAIIISAFSDYGKTEGRLLQEGASAYIEKPISSLKDLEALIVKVSKRTGPLGSGLDI